MFDYTILVKQNNVRNIYINGGNNMRIVNKKKFIRMVILVMGFIILLFICFSNISFSKGEVKTKTIYVSSGDTLWTIAKEEQENNSYYEDKDIRDIVYQIKKLNNIQNNSNLIEGQKIIIEYM